jgi:hypothetical protein
MDFSLAWSNFALQHSRYGTGNSYSTLSNEEVLKLVQENWDQRRPGAGETDLNRKVLVPVPVEHMFCSPRAEIVMGLPVRARVVQRQAGEDPYIETYITPEDAEKFGVKQTPAKKCDIVCYSADALLENGGERSSEADWEIVTILAYPDDFEEPVPPLTLARNYLNKPGGTYGEYSAKEFAESIYYHATKKTVKIMKE